MAYTKTVWTDRVVQYANRYKDQNNVVYTFTRDSGEVVEAGTPVNAGNLNKLEQGVYDTSVLLDELATNKETALDGQVLTSNGDGTAQFETMDLSIYAPLASPTFTGTVTLPVTNNYSTATTTQEKIGHDTMSGTSKTVTDAFITANTFVTIIPLSNPSGVMTVTSNAGNFVITSTKSETLIFKWMAVK